MTLERRTRSWTLHRASPRTTEGEMLRKLTRAVMATCLWAPEEEGVVWSFGDMRFLTVVADIAGTEDSAYAQVFSAPYASSAIEVSSGRLAPKGAFAHLPVSGGRRAKVLRRLGLTLPRRGREDWSRDLPPLDEAGCASLARTVLTALTEALGWTPALALHAAVLHETSLSEAEAFLEGVRPVHVEGLLREAGLEVVGGEDEDDGHPAFLVQGGGPLPFQVELLDPVKDEDDAPDTAWNYGTLVFSLAISVEEGDALALALALHGLTRWARVELPEENRVVVNRHESLEGVTPEAVRAMVERWLEELTAVRSRLEQGPAEIEEEE